MTFVYTEEPDAPASCDTMGIMSSGTKVGNVPRVRTYRDDLLRAQGKTDIDAETQPSKPTKIPTPAPPAPSTPPKIVVPITPNESARPIHTPPPAPERPAVPARTFRTDATATARDLKKIETRKRASSLSTNDDPLNAELAQDLGDGSIVTDTKRDRFKLLPAVKHAFTEWLFEKKEAYDERKKPKFTVAPAQDRKEVIERAATGGVLAPKNDYETVATRLRHVPRVKISAKPTIRSASEVPKPAWSHEVGDPTPEPTPHIPPAPREPEAQPPVSPPPEPIPPPVETSEPVVETPPVAEPEVPRPEPEPMRAPLPVSEAPAASEPSRVSYAPPRQVAPSRIRIYLLVLIAIVAIASGVGVTVWLFGGVRDGEQAAPQMTDAAIEQSLITADAIHPVPLQSPRDAFFAELSRAVAESDRGSITYLASTVSENGDVRLARVEEVVSILNLSAPGAFLRAIESVGFGALDGETPFVILRVPNFDTALGGMLAWEPFIDTDLASFFGTSGIPGAPAPTFIDVVHGNRDMRILYDSNGDDRLVYSFPNRTTILITTTRTAAERLLPLIQ